MANKIAVLLEYVELNVPRDKRAGYVQRINVFNGWLVALEFDTWLSKKGVHLRTAVRLWYFAVCLLLLLLLPLTLVLLLLLAD